MGTNTQLQREVPVETRGERSHPTFSTAAAWGEHVRKKEVLDLVAESSLLQFLFSLTVRREEGESEIQEECRDVHIAERGGFLQRPGQGGRRWASWLLVCSALRARRCLRSLRDLVYFVHPIIYSLVNSSGTYV